MLRNICQDQNETGNSRCKNARDKASGNFITSSIKL